MAGWFLPGDPYFMPGMGTGGWLEEPSLPTPPADVIDLDTDTEEEEIPSTEEEEPILGSDADTEVVSLDGNHDSILSNEENHAEEEEDEEPMEEDVVPITEVRKPRAVLRSLHMPRPEPSFRVYRHPGGPLWKYTPRKRVLPVRRTNPLLTLTSSQERRRPQWMTELHTWSREQHQLPPYGLSHGQLDLPAGGQGDRALPVVVRRIMVVGDQIRASTSKIHDVGTATQTTACHLSHLDEEHEMTRTMVGQTQQELDTTRAELAELRTRHAALEREMAETRQEVQELRVLLAFSSGGPRNVILLD